MNLLIAVVYAPLLFFSLQRFDIQIVSIGLFFLSCLWLVFVKSNKERLYPLAYIFISIIGYFLDSFFILKSLPLLISIFMTSLILISYLQKNSIILYFAKKFSKKSLSKDEEEYIHRSTLFWFGISCINVGFHTLFLLGDNTLFWVYYSSFIWYFLFIFAGVLQFLHRKFIFERGR